MDNKITDFTELEVWKLAHQLRLEIYKFVKFLPKEENFNRISQLRRSVSSVPANIAEGFGRYHYQENVQFCRQDKGSLEETKDNLIAAKDLNQAPKDECERLIRKSGELRKVLNGYISYLKKKKDQLITNN